MKILDRYVLREVLIPFLLGIGIFTCLLLIARILKLVELVVNRGVPFLRILQLFSYIMPAFLEVTVPMALLLGVLVGFGRLSSDSEVVALQASGVHFYRFAAPVGYLAAFVVVLTMILSVYVRPWGNSQLRAGLYGIVKARATAGLRPRVFNDDFLGLVIYVDRVDPSGSSLRGILISDRRDPKMQNTVFSRYGAVVTDEATQTLTLRLTDGNIYTRSEKSGFQDTRFGTYDINLSLSDALQSVSARERDVSELQIAELRQRMHNKQAAGDPAYAEQVELARKHAIPFGCLIFAALGASLGIRPSRAVHSWGFAISLLLIFAYYLLLTLGQSLGERGTLPASVALWLPNGVLGVIAVGLLRRSRNGPQVGMRFPGTADWTNRIRVALGN